MKPIIASKANVEYAYSDYEIRTINDARNSENNYEIVDAALCERKKNNKLYFFAPDVDTMVVELESFWLREGETYFGELLFKPRLQQIKKKLTKEGNNFQRVKFIFSYRLEDMWHWNAAEIIFLKNKGNWHVSGAKYDPYGSKKELEEGVIKEAKTRFFEVILDGGAAEIISDKIEKIDFASGQKGGVGCGMYAAFILHKLKSKDFTTQEALENEQDGVWSGLAHSDKEQREEDLRLVNKHFPEKIEKFGKISENGFVDNTRYLPRRIAKKMNYQTKRLNIY